MGPCLVLFLMFPKACGACLFSQSWDVWVSSPSALHLQFSRTLRWGNNVRVERICSSEDHDHAGVIAWSPFTCIFWRHISGLGDFIRGRNTRRIRVADFLGLVPSLQPSVHTFHGRGPVFLVMCSVWQQVVGPNVCRRVLEGQMWRKHKCSGVQTVHESSQRLLEYVGILL